MSESTDNPVQRLIVAVGGALLLICVICNLAFVWRNIALHRELVNAQVRLQQVNQTQQLIPAIVNDLLALSGQHPWLNPILQKYGLRQGGQNAAAPQVSQPRKQP